MCEREGCDTDVTAAPSGPEKRFCSSKCRAKASRMKPSAHKNSIPGDVFRKCIEPFLAANEDALTRLAVACNIKHDSLYCALRRDHIDFDLCDLILCKLNAFNLWHEEEGYLPERGARRMKYAAEDGTVRCARRGCSNRFERGSGRGKQRQIYCSRRCCDIAAKVRRGAMAPPSLTRDFVCRHGHERTPESVQHLSDGTRRCRICARARTNESRARQRELRAALLAEVAA